MREKLRSAFETKSWAGGRSKAPRSGPGSDMESTAALRKALPDIFERYSVKRFLDAPCGDWHWMQTVDLDGIDYIGADISKTLIEENTAAFAKDGVRFVHLDITSDELPASDLLLCRDCMFHLKFWLRWQFFENFAKSDSRYLMLTMHHVEVNDRVRVNGGFKPFNPTVEPFNLPQPLEMIPEQTKGTARSLAIWSRAQVKEALLRRKSSGDEEEE